VRSLTTAALSQAVAPAAAVVVALFVGGIFILAVGRDPLAVYGAMVTAGTVLMEPYQRVFIDVPNDVMGSAAREIQQRRGEIVDMKSEGELTKIEALTPVAEMFGFASAIRGATAGRALWSTENAGFKPVPREILGDVVRKIRERKGLKPDPPTASYYAG